MHNDEIIKLVDKYLSGKATEEEKATLLEWYRSANNEDIEWKLDPGDDEETLKTRILDGIDDKVNLPDERPSTPSAARLLVAASIIAAFLAIGLFFFNNQEAPVLAEKEPVEPASEIPSGANAAYLTLADGSRIVLDGSRSGKLTEQGGSEVLKSSEGELIYRVQGNDASAVVYNTLSTPAGGKYMIVLPDGSRVWLNASSSLRFPTAFSESREVELAGEGYFEVAPAKNKPFRVKSQSQIVEVLGTQFNVNAYTDEPTVNTTLLEGSVNVKSLKGSASRTLRPGEQSRLGKEISIIKVDPRFAIAWKDGYFRFENSDLKSVLRQLGRWYGVSIRNETNIPGETYGGAIDMNLSLTQVLEILEGDKVTFKLEGRQIVVLPK